MAIENHLRRVLAATFVASLLGSASPPSQAALVSLDIQLRPTDIYFLPHADGTIEIDAFPTFPQVTVNVGDHLTVRYTFDGFRVLLGDTGDLNSGLEAITFTMLPFSPTLTGHADVSMNLLGVAGNFTSSNPIYQVSVGFGGGFANQAAVDLTSSKFLFSGAVLDADFSTLSEPLVLNRALWGAYGGSIRLVPEPNALGLFSLLPVAVAILSRRRRSST